MRKIPTVWQAQTLKMLIEGWLLLWEKDRIYWQKNNGGFIDDVIECSYVKIKARQMFYIENYNWVIRTKTGWKITKQGKMAFEAYEKYYS